MAEVSGGSRVIAALEGAWADIQRRHPDVPGVVLVTGEGPVRRGGMELGHFGAGRWHTADGRLPQVFLAGELLAASRDQSPGRRVLKTLLHEACHGVAHTRKIQDCSRQNRYHNKRFVAIAAELGLVAPDAPHPTIGWSEVRLDEKGAALWAGTIAAIDAAALPHLRGLGLVGAGGQVGDGEDGEETAGGAGKGGRSGARRSAVCGCNPPRRLSVTLKQLELGGILCAICMGEFEHQEEDQEADDPAED